jgi:transcriptional regulator with XRE-family HTH domain
MTIAKLAEIAGLSVSTIGDAEGGRVTPSLPVLRKLARALDVSVAYLGCFEKLPEETLGQRIRKARLCKGLMKVEFAQVLGVNVKTLREWESDKRKPSREYLAMLEEHLRASLGQSVSTQGRAKHPGGEIRA